MNNSRDSSQGRQVAPAAGVWACDHCGRRIQVIQDAEHEKVQPFVCVCGSVMEPGEEHSRPDKDLQSRVIDD